MTEQELKQAAKPVRSLFLSQFSEYYGIGYWLKKYAGFPTWLPILIHCDHAPTMEENLLEFELDSTYKKALFHNHLKVKDGLAKKFKEIHITGSPYVHYCKMMNIKKDASRKGTVCFPFHSTTNIDPLVNWEEYIEDLNRLSVDFHPITICLHHIDIDKGSHKLFLENHFEVVCAGHKLNHKFTENFYNIIKNKKYATSNACGSYVSYCVDFGIPFFFYGSQDIKIKNTGNTSLLLGTHNLEEYLKTNRDIPYYFKAKELFKDPSEEITKEQKEFADTLLGMDKAIHAKTLRKILWKEFLLNGPHFLCNMIKNKLKKLVK